jgi:hypothetical protein
MRKQDAAKIKEEQAVLSLYMDALGMLADTPLREGCLVMPSSRQELRLKRM